MFAASAAEARGIAPGAEQETTAPDGYQIGEEHPDVEVLVLTFSGALLQAGMGLLTYDQIAERLVAAVDVILRGN